MKPEALQGMKRAIYSAMRLGLVGGTWNSAAFAAPSYAPATLCTASEITIFSCTTKEHRVISICLTDSAQLYIRKKEKTEQHISDRVRHAQEAIVGVNPHGNSIVLRLVTASHTDTLFVSQDRYDMDGGTFVISNGHDSTKECLLDSKRTDAGFLVLNGKETYVGLGALASAGLASHWTSPPKWPGT